MASGPLTLEMLVLRKQQLEAELKQLEKQIFDLETTYLEEPSNITNGWEVNSLLERLFFAVERIKQYMVFRAY